MAAVVGCAAPTARYGADARPERSAEDPDRTGPDRTDPGRAEDAGRTAPEPPAEAAPGRSGEPAPGRPGGPDPGAGPVAEAVAGLADAARAPGAAAYARDGGRVWFAASGVADRRETRPIGRADRFRAGSVTKTFVATVVLQLHAEGALRLSDPVERHLPGLVRGRGNDGTRVTLRQLLTHTSGLYDYVRDPRLAEESFGRGFPEHRYATRSPRELVRTALRHRPYFPPGRGYFYSNTDYILLGLVVERVTGRPYARAVEERVIRPLRLTGTSFPGTRSGLPRPHGRGYSAAAGGSPDRPMDVTELNPSTAGAAGEMISTFGDLSRFLRALLGGELLPDAELRLMRDTSGTRGRYGYGLFPERLPCGVTVWGHNGSISGSYVRITATAGGGRVLGYRVNTDEVGDAAAERRLLTAEFCRRD
ncbi:serine hydrolase domain-containing protein [Streptomyces zingiberis]|uniref:serine hydrolase domain-containing protein n=1 Tax=Streptomyces zingiberis TaxID=2053010 RepID=UPI0028929FD9|nr:serine hydrolase domain-containing protein [Streptomyces zingiberis]